MVKRHIPILVDEIVSYIPWHTRHIVDGTCGHGGHTIHFLQWLSDNGWGIMTACDRDDDVLTYAKHIIWSESQALAHAGLSINYIHDTYANLHHHLSPWTVDYLLLDLGINRHHVTDDTRWFSFQGDGPLDMRFDPSRWYTAYEVITSSSIDEMKEWFMIYGDIHEKRAMSIATLISNHKNDIRLTTTLGFVSLLQEIRVHKKELAPIFQCIRIATNKEFDHVDTFFQYLDHILAPWGRCAIISFHSVEDRIIKYHNKALVEDKWYHLVNKHVITPHRTEVKANKASRSAKLRIIEKPL